MSKIVITGGAGFIGSHLVRRYLELGDDVVVIDNLSTGIRANIPDNAKFILYDVSQPIAHGVFNKPVMKAFEGADLIYHLAGMTRPVMSIANPESCLNMNVTGTLNVLEACRAARGSFLIYVSSAAVYGSQSCPFSEDDSKPSPGTPYATSKLIGELLCEMYWKVYEVQSVCLRPFNVYGSRMNKEGAYAGVITKFIQNRKNGRAPIIYGDGNQKRDFIHVDDVVDAMISAAIECNDIVGETINIGTGENHSINQIDAIIRAIIGTEDKAVHTAFQNGDQKDTLASTKKARWFLDWQAKVGIYEGLEKLIAEWV